VRKQISSWTSSIWLYLGPPERAKFNKLTDRKRSQSPASRNSDIQTRVDKPKAVVGVIRGVARPSMSAVFCGQVLVSSESATSGQSATSRCLSVLPGLLGRAEFVSILHSHTDIYCTPPLISSWFRSDPVGVRQIRAKALRRHTSRRPQMEKNKFEPARLLLQYDHCLVTQHP